MVGNLKIMFQKKTMMYSTGEAFPILYFNFLEVPEDEHFEGGERNEHITLGKTLRAEQARPRVP